MIMVVMKIFHFWPQYYPCYMLPCLLEIILAIQSRKIVSLQTRCRVLIVSENLPGMDDTKVIFQIYLLYTIPNIKKIKGIYTDDYIFIIGETTNGWNNCLASLSTLWSMEKVSKIRLTIFSNFCYTKKLQRLSIHYVGYWCVSARGLDQICTKYFSEECTMVVEWFIKRNITSLHLDHP